MLDLREHGEAVVKEEEDEVIVMEVCDTNWSVVLDEEGREVMIID